VPLSPRAKAAKDSLHPVVKRIDPHRPSG